MMNMLSKPEREDMMLDFYSEFDHLRDAMRLFKKNVIANKTQAPQLLDIGCKDDKLRPYFTHLGFTYTGVDLHPKNNNVVKADMHDLPFGDESFGVIFCCHTLEHSNNIIKAIAEMARVCKIGGVIFIATPIHCNYQIFECDRTHLLVPTKEQMEKLFYLNGIQPIKIEEWNVEGQEDRFATLISIGRVVK